VYETGVAQASNQSLSCYRTEIPKEYHGENTGHEFDVNGHTNISEKHNGDVPNRQSGQLNSDSAVSEGDIVLKHQVGNLKSADVNVANNGSTQKMSSHVPSTYDKQRNTGKNSHTRRTEDPLFCGDLDTALKLLTLLNHDLKRLHQLHTFLKESLIYESTRQKRNSKEWN
jgi:hypothetical protein